MIITIITVYKSYSSFYSSQQTAFCSLTLCISLSFFWEKILTCPSAINAVDSNNTIKILGEYVFAFIIQFPHIIRLVIFDLKDIDLQIKQK